MTYQHYYGAMSKIKQNLFMMGGNTPRTGTLEVFDLSKGNWEEGPSLPRVLSGLESVADDQNVFAIGMWKTLIIFC